MYFRKSGRPAELAGKYRAAYAALLNKYYVDQLYDMLFVNRSKGAGVGLWRFDAGVVDGGVNGSAWLTVKSAVASGWGDRWIVDGLVRFVGAFVRTFSWPVRLIQTGYVQNYAMLMLLGVLFFIGYVIWS
jgi:NADH-quinone oxidoreductase subunit L